MSNSIKSISSEIKSLRSIFITKEIFKIPDFQRDFVWEEEEVKKLFEDFSEDTNDFKELTEEGYLLGNIVTIKQNEGNITYKEVIDGQQRLTVLSLIFYCLNQLIESIKQDIITTIKPENDNVEEAVKKINAWSGLSNELDIAYNVKINSEEQLKIQHDPSLIIGENYRAFFSNGQSDETSLLGKVYNEIEEQIQTIYKGSEDGEEKIKNLIKFLKDEVYLIETSATSLSKAFQLFEVLNHRGVDLTPLDLIKNLLLKKLVETDEKDEIKTKLIINARREKFGKLWLMFTSKLEFNDRRRKPINSSTFLKHFLIGTKGKKVSDKKLFTYFSELEYEQEEILTIVQDFINVLTIYRDFEQKKYDRFTEDGYVKLILKLLFESFKNKQVHSLLIPFYYESEPLKAKVINYAARLVAAITFADSCIVQNKS